MKIRGLSMLALVALPAVLFAAVPSEAGQGNTPYASCSKNADGSGNCVGWLSAFRSSSDVNAIAYFQTSTYFSPEFVAETGGAWYSCSVVPGSPVATLFPQVMATVNNTGVFNISWDKTGACTQVLTTVSSSYK
jgi:hypothetical protein